MDTILQLCIQQGYVPEGCQLDGMLVFGLVNAGKIPCDGCNANCSYNFLRQGRELSHECKN